VLLAGLLCAALARGDTDGPSPRIVVVVGRASIVKEISRDTLRDVYLRRQRVWSDGTRAIPINLPVGNPVRERFSTLVLGRSTQELVSYWSARYFEGITPPAVVSSPAAIRAYLNAEPGAVAYLPATEVDETCRFLLSLE